MDDERTDNMLMMIARQHTGGVDALLDTFFGFLRRRTDFFTGAEPAVIEKTVLDAARRQRGIADREKAKREAEAERKREEARSKVKPATATSTTAAAAAAVLSDSEVVEVSSDGSFDAAAMTAPTVAASSSAAAAAAAAPPSRTAETAAASVSASTEAPVAAAAAASSSSSVAASTPSDDAPAGDDGDAEDSDSAGKLRPNRGNGADQDRYSWSQTLKEVTIVMPMPKGIKSKQLAIDITATTIQCGVAGQPPVLRGKLCKPILTEETSWTLDDAPGGGRSLSIFLTKSYQMEWWDCVAEGEPKIDLKKVEPENSKLDDLDHETRKTVEKMMFDSRQKAMGRPTSDELQKQRMLEQFMKQHPEMDFSKAKIT